MLEKFGPQNVVIEFYMLNRHRWVRFFSSIVLFTKELDSETHAKVFGTVTTLFRV